MLPDAITNEADKAAMNKFSSIVLPGRQITAATITEAKVIRKFKGRISFIIAVSFSINAFKMLMRDSPKITKRKRNCSVCHSEPA
jgi:hypothetical protein